MHQFGSEMHVEVVWYVQLLGLNYSIVNGFVPYSLLHFVRIQTTYGKDYRVYWSGNIEKLRLRIIKILTEIHGRKRVKMPSLYTFKDFHAELNRYGSATFLCYWLMLLNSRVISVQTLSD